MSFQATGTQDVQPMKLKPHQKFEGHTDWVSGVIQLPGGQEMITSSGDGSLRVWNLHTGKQIANWQDGRTEMGAIALSPDGKKVVSGSSDSAVRLWDVDTGNVIAKWMGHSQAVNSVCWNEDAGRVVSGSTDGTARVWDVESGKTILEINSGSTWMWTAIYSQDATMIATGGEQQPFIQIWDGNTSQNLAKLKGHTSTVNCLVWASNGRMLISSSDDHSIRTWNTSTWQQISVLTGHTSFVSAISISPNNLILASASWDGTARLWNLENGEPIGEPLPHESKVQCVSFSTDGKLLATASYYQDNNAYTWDVCMIVRETGLDELLLTPNSVEDASAFDVDATHPFAHSAVNDDARHDPHVNFFASSQSSLPSPRRRLQKIFSLLRSPMNYSTPLQERLRRRFIAPRTPSTSPLHVPATSERTNPTSETKIIAGNEERDNLLDCSTNITPGTAEHNNNKVQQAEELIPHTQTPSPARIDSSESRAFWKLLMRARGKDSKNSPVRMTQDPSPEVVESNEDGMSQASSSSSPGPSMARYMWNTLIPSRYHPPVNDSIPLQPPFDRSFFSPRTGSRPVTVYAARPKKLYWIAPRTTQPANQSVEQGNGNGDENDHSSRPLQTNITQQSAGATQTQPSSALHMAVSSSSTTPTVAAALAATTSVSSPLVVTIPRAGYWTRFRLLICFPSAQYNDGHN